MWYGDAGAPMHEWRDAAAIREQDGSATGDGLRSGVAKVFILRGKHEDVRVAVRRPFGIAVQRTGEKHAVSQAQIPGANLQLPEVAVAFVRSGQNQNGSSAGVRLYLCKGFQEEIGAFFADEASEVKDDGRIGRNAPLAAELTLR